MTGITMIITGASRGLGEATARIAAEMGANVVINARSEGRLKAVADHIKSTGGSALAIPGDVTREDDRRRLVDAALETFGRIDALVNNAGVLEPLDHLADSNPSAWQYNLEVNLFGAVDLTRAVLPSLRASHGRLVHVSSGAAFNPTPGWSAYCASKAAINQFSRVLALEEPDITSLTFRPGAVDTRMQSIIRQVGQEVMDEERYERFIRLYQEGELLPPEKPGRALALLALHAPHEWSGEFIQWNEDRLQSLPI